MASTYEEVASNTGLVTKQVEEYAYYMRTRYPGSETAFCAGTFASFIAAQWLAGTVYERSDATGQTLIQQIDDNPGVYA